MMIPTTTTARAIIPRATQVLRRPTCRIHKKPTQSFTPLTTSTIIHRNFTASTRTSSASERRPPPAAPSEDAANLKSSTAAPTYLGTQKRLPEYNLVDKVVLVSGGARGLGLTQAEALCEAGAKVYCLDLHPSPSPNFTKIQARASQELGTSLHYRQVDVRDEAKLQTIVSEIADENGRMDGLIAAAGINEEYPALEYTANDFNRMMEINVTGAFLMSQAVARQMVKFGNGGSIVMVGSMSATIANRGLICPAYNASKAAVVQLGRNLASEWGEYGIRVNTLSPGYIVTEMVENLFKQFPERRTEWPKQNMLGRLSSPREYRGAAVFLLSDASSFMTGADLREDGGHAAW